MKLSKLPLIFAIHDHNNVLKKEEIGLPIDNLREEWAESKSVIHNTKRYELNNFYKPIALKFNVSSMSNELV